MDHDLRPSGRALAAAAAVVLTAAVFWPVLSHGFLNYDDGALAELARLGWRGLPRLLTAPFFCNYSPLSWAAFDAIAAVSGPDPAAYHLWSLVLHAANAGLVFVLALRLLRGKGELDVGAALVAALAFALHPLRVEPVAWAFELREPLCALLVLLALRAWLDARAGKALLFFAAALLAKPAALPFPAGLVALAAGLGELPADPRRWADATRRAFWRRLAPFFVLSALFAAVAAAAQSSCGAVDALARCSAAARAERVLAGLVFYLGKTAWPSGLTLYEWHVAPLLGGLVVGGLATLGVLVLAAARRDWRAPLLTALAWQTVFLAPTLGVVVLGHSPFADRYAYLAGLGWALLAGAGWRLLAARSRAAATLVAVLVLGALAGATRVQLGVWTDSASLWTRVLSRDPDSWVARPNLAQALLAAGRRDLAAALLEDHLRVYPDDAETRANLDAVRRGASAR